MAELHLSKQDSVTTIDSLAWLPYWVYREDKAGKSVFYVLPVAKYESDTTIVKLTTGDLYRFNRFVNDTRKHLSDSPVMESSFYRKTEEPERSIKYYKERTDTTASP
jgi:hypothetical protein